MGIKKIVDQTYGEGYLFLADPWCKSNTGIEISPLFIKEYTRIMKEFNHLQEKLKTIEKEN